MAEEVDAAVIKKTQDILGSVIKKPALTEKSLKKPPFRFLHDVITNVIKTTGFLKGLYTPDDLRSDNVKDKDSKMAFLQKAIDVLALVTEQPVNLKPSKVVAGHEPQKTNAFLQALGMAIKNKLDSKEAVAKVLSEGGQGSPVKAVKEKRGSVDKRSKGEKSHARSLTRTLDPAKKGSTSNATENKDSTKKKDAEKEKHKDSKSKDREKSRERSKHAKSEDSKKASKDRASHSNEVPQIENEIQSSPTHNDLHPNQDGLENHVPTNEEPQEPETSPVLINGDINEKDDLPVRPEENEQPELNERPVREKSHRVHSSRGSRPPSAKTKRTKPTDDGGPPTDGFVKEPLLPVASTSTSNVSSDQFLQPRPPSARPPSARPSSSRPAPPRIRIRHVVDNEEPSVRPTTAKPVENVILDQSQQSEDEDEEELLVVEAEPQKNLEQMTSLALPAETPEEDKGSLVKKLLETKKDLEGGSQHTSTKKVEIDKSQMTEASRLRERDLAMKELEQLQSSINTLSKTAIPLGRMLDFLQEDIDAMKMELKMWRDEHEQNLIALRREQSATESSLEPLRAQLDDLDQVVQNQLDANSALKSSIARNDERIQRMLAHVNHKS